MTWYAVRITPKASREAVRLRYFRGKRNGLHVVRQPVENKFAVEQDLLEQGFTCYSPIETLEIIRHRTKKLATVRRLLLPGYVFVQNPHDWQALTEVRGIAGVLGSGGIPIIIRDKDIADLKQSEAENEEAIVFARWKREEEARRLTRRILSGNYPKGMRVTITHAVIGRQQAHIVSTTGRMTVKVMAEFLGGLVPVEVPLASISKAA
jgi:transcription antitermination factor NusG